MRKEEISMKKRTLMFMVFCVLIVCLSACVNREIKNTDESTANTENNKIWTIDFEMKVPEYWVGKYVYDLNPKGDQLDVRMITDKTEKGAHLFTIYINPLEERDTIIENLEFGIEPIGLLESKDGNRYFLGLLYASEMACEESEEEIFLNLTNSIPKVLETITPSEGCKILEWNDSYLTGSDNIIEKNQYNMSLSDAKEKLEPIIDGSLGRCLINFSNKSINAVLNDRDARDALAIQVQILDVLNPIVYAQPPQGYALEQKWSVLKTDCNIIINSVQKCIDAIYDKDSTTVFEAKDVYSNTDILAHAIEIRNVVKKHLAESEKLEQNNKIIGKYTLDECKQKAYRYARYRFPSDDMILIEPQSAMTTSDISGKYYEFKIQNEDKTSILINVEDLSIIERINTSGNYYSYRYISDGQLPAENGDESMPNIIGMTKEEAISIIEKMGYSYEFSGYMDCGNVEAGLVCHSYPEAGRVLLPNTVIHFSIQTKND